MSASFSVTIASCLASNSQKIKKTIEDSYIWATTMLSQTVSNNSDFQKFQGQFEQVRLAISTFQSHKITWQKGPLDIAM